MDLPADLRERLVNEIGFVVEGIRTQTDLRKKVYYFSGVYAEMFRLLNISYDPQLLFAHNILSSAYQSMRALSDTIELGRDTTIVFPDNFFERLCALLEQMANQIENNQETYNTLQAISCLSYINTGNGYYLFLKGILTP
jgi:hypothetical protein